MANLTQEQVEKLVKKVTEDFLLDEKQLNFQQFKIICKNYLNEINKQIQNLQTRKDLMDRIQAIGSIMHGDVSAVQRILILSHYR